MPQNAQPSTAINFEESELLKNVQQLEDPRTRWTQHSLTDIVIIAIMAVLSGADDWNAIQAYGDAKKTGCQNFSFCPTEFLHMTPSTTLLVA